MVEYTYNKMSNEELSEAAEASISNPDSLEKILDEYRIRANQADATAEDSFSQINALHNIYALTKDRDVDKKCYDILREKLEFAAQQDKTLDFFLDGFEEYVKSDANYLMVDSIESANISDQAKSKFLPFVADLGIGHTFRDAFALDIIRCNCNKIKTLPIEEKLPEEVFNHILGYAEKKAELLLPENAIRAISELPLNVNLSNKERLANYPVAMALFNALKKEPNLAQPAMEQEINRGLTEKITSRLETMAKKPEKFSAKYNFYYDLDTLKVIGGASSKRVLKATLNYCKKEYEHIDIDVLKSFENFATDDTLGWNEVDSKATKQLNDLILKEAAERVKHYVNNRYKGVFAGKTKLFGGIVPGSEGLQEDGTYKAFTYKDLDERQLWQLQYNLQSHSVANIQYLSALLQKIQINAAENGNIGEAKKFQTQLDSMRNSDLPFITARDNGEIDVWISEKENEPQAQEETIEAETQPAQGKNKTNNLKSVWNSLTDKISKKFDNLQKLVEANDTEMPDTAPVEETETLTADEQNVLHEEAPVLPEEMNNEELVLDLLDLNGGSVDEKPEAEAEVPVVETTEKVETSGTEFVINEGAEIEAADVPVIENIAEAEAPTAQAEEAGIEPEPELEAKIEVEADAEVKEVAEAKVEAEKPVEAKTEPKAKVKPVEEKTDETPAPMPTPASKKAAGHVAKAAEAKTAIAKAMIEIATKAYGADSKVPVYDRMSENFDIRVAPEAEQTGKEEFALHRKAGDKSQAKITGHIAIENDRELTLSSKEMQHFILVAKAAKKAGHDKLKVGKLQGEGEASMKFAANIVLAGAITGMKVDCEIPLEKLAEVNPKINILIEKRKLREEIHQQNEKMKTSELTDAAEQFDKLEMLKEKALAYHLEHGSIDERNPNDTESKRMERMEKIAKEEPKAKDTVKRARGLENRQMLARVVKSQGK